MKTVKSIGFHAGGISRRLGQSVASAIAYAQGGRFHDEYSGKTYRYGKREDLLHCEILLPEGAPPEYHSCQVFLDALNASEKRKDALMAHKYILALPNELGKAEWLRLIHEFAQDNFVKEGFSVYFALHSGLADKHIKPDKIQPVTERCDNPHVHMLVPFRQVGEDGFYPEKSKGRATYQKKFLYQLRESWAEIQNRSFERLGTDVRVTAASYKKRGISRLPTPHLGAGVIEKEAAEIRTELGDRYREIIAENKARERQIETELQREAESVQKHELELEREM